jgi:serine/threonine protein kinase
MRVPRVSELVPNIPRDLDDMVYRCLQTRPEDRFQSVDDLVSAIGQSWRPVTPETRGTLADLLGDNPATLVDVLPIFSRIIRKLAVVYQDESSHPVLTPKTIRCGPNDVQIKTISAVEAQYTRAVDCKYAASEDFSESTPRAGRRVESDIYVLGLIFYEILLGQKLFRAYFGDLYKGDWNFQWLHWHSDPAKNAPPLKEALPDIPVGLSDLVESMMQKPVERRPDLARVEASLIAVMDHLTREVMKTVVLKRQAPASKKTARKTSGVVALVIFGVILAIAVWLALKSL